MQWRWWEDTVEDRTLMWKHVRPGIASTLAVGYFMLAAIAVGVVLVLLWRNFA